MMLSFKTYSQPLLNSLPSASATIYLDFYGEYVNSTSWNGGTPFYCAPPGLTDSQITEIFNRVSEDYRPFNVTITTDSTVFLAAPIVQRTRIIVTSTNDWYQGVGGVAYTGSFIWGDDTPAFVFSSALDSITKDIAECCSHEAGHTLGLVHQSTFTDSCTLVTVYNDGVGTGEIGWAPIMGNSYGRNLTGWSNGPTPSGCSVDQDNLSIITTRNGFTYLPDDYSDDPNVNPTVIPLTNFQFSATSGIITTSTDKDAFKITLPAPGVLQLNASPYSVGPNGEGADLDVQVTLLDSSMQVVQVYNPADSLDVNIDTVVNAGNYYLVVQGAGNANTSNYGSLGSYKISGTLSPLIVLPIKQVLLSGEPNNGIDNLSWNIISEEPLQTLSLESSYNGSNFTTLTSLSVNATTFNYTPLISGNIFYRLKTTSVTGQLVYSNIISLNQTGNPDNLFTVSTLVSSEIRVAASQNYQYQLIDVSGRILQTGSDNAGVNNINVSNCPNGIYFLQILGNSQRTTQRIVKL